MNLTENQKNAVKTWIKSGASLSEVQSQLQEEFDITMTFMDVRFLVDDLDLELQDEANKKKTDSGDDILKKQGGQETGERAEPSQGDAAQASGNGAGASAEDLELMNEGGSGRVSVSVDAVQSPGTVVSGSATFSDGENLKWQIDQMGRLGLIPNREGYQPPEQDMAEFQETLQNELQKKGF